MEKIYWAEVSVRDYECDQQNIVNNAVYQNYLQHARHEMGREVGMDWLELNKKGIDLVLRRAELDYLRPLYAGDRIKISAKPYRKGLFRLFFDQEIILLPSEILVLKAKMAVACVVDGKPAAVPELERWFGRAG